MSGKDLTPETAAKLYRSGQSACQVASTYGTKRKTAESKIRQGGLTGLQWCPVHQALEELNGTGS